MRFLEGHTGPVYSLAISPEGTRLTSAGKDGTVREHSLFEFGQVWFLKPACDEPAVAVNYSAVPGTIAIGSLKEVWLWNDGRRLEAMDVADGHVTCLAFCDRGRYLAIGTGNRVDAGRPGMLLLVELTSRRVIQQHGATNGIWSLAATPLGKRVLCGGGDKRVTRWDLTAQDRRITPVHNREVRALALSPDATIFAAADDYLIRIYDTETMQEQRQLVAHKGRVDALAFSPDGRTLFSGAWDKQVKTWDPYEGHEISAHDWGIGNVRALAISPDGLLGAAAGDRGTIVLWDVDG